MWPWGAALAASRAACARRGHAVTVMLSLENAAASASWVCELGPPGLLLLNAEASALPANPSRMYHREKPFLPPPGCSLNLTLTSSSPRGKQTGTKPPGWKGQWSAPSLLLGCHPSHQGRASVPPSCCSQGWTAWSLIPEAALTGTGDLTWERVGLCQVWTAPQNVPALTPQPAPRTPLSVPDSPGVLRSLRNTAGSGFSSRTLEGTPWDSGLLSLFRSSLPVSTTGFLEHSAGHKGSVSTVRVVGVVLLFRFT